MFMLELAYVVLQAGIDILLIGIPANCQSSKHSSATADSVVPERRVELPLHMSSCVQSELGATFTDSGINRDMYNLAFDPASCDTKCLWSLSPVCAATNFVSLCALTACRWQTCLRDNLRYDSRSSLLCTKCVEFLQNHGLLLTGMHQRQLRHAWLSVSCSLCTQSLMYVLQSSIPDYDPQSAALQQNIGDLTLHD